MEGDQRAARADIDAILHLGDYIYEYGTNEYGNVRPYEPAHEMITLEDYRTRHAYYKQEPDLMELHRQFPFITTWDDHESTDNSWRDSAVNHTEGEEGVWAIRKAWAQQAYDEWMPIRYPETGRTDKIWRRFNYGDLADIFVLDTRLYDRDEPDGIPADPAVAKDPARRMLGPEQMNWLLDGLASSSAQWKLIAQQVVFHQWQLVPGAQATGGGTQLNGDAWDGYQAERQQIIDALRASSIQNVVVLTGEFGRTPTVELTNAGKSKLGRDNNSAGFSMVLAGGGVKGGTIYGATDEFGFRAAENPVHVHDLHATILHLMGFDHERLTYRFAGRDFRLTDVHGEVIDALIA